MSKPASNPIAEAQIKLVKAALSSSPEAALSELLSGLCKQMRAFGCILWKAASSDPPALGPLEGAMYELAAWFPRARRNKGAPIHEISTSGTISGLALEKQKIVICNQIWWRTVQVLEHDPRIQVVDPFLIQNKITKMISCPLGRPNAHATINCYRKSNHPDFTRQDGTNLRKLAETFPDLLSAIRSRLGSSLLRDVANLTQRPVDQPQADRVLSWSDQREVMDKTATFVAKAFHAVEASVFLEKDADSNYAHLIGTSWADDFPTNTYKRGTNEGLTGWVFDHGKPMHLFDLERYEPDAKINVPEYEGAIWKDSLKFKIILKKRLGIQQNDRWPMSYIAAPIMAQNRVLGVIRCCTAREAPYYFTTDDVQLLQLVAAQISLWRDQCSFAEALQRARLDLAAQSEKVTQDYEDLSHQLHSPILQAERQVTWALETALPVSSSTPLQAARGLCRKARRVSSSIGLIADDSTKKATHARFEPLRYHKLDKLLIEAAQDNEIIAGRGIRFSVERQSYNVNRLDRFSADFALLEQAVSNLLDNAGKYSNSDSRVRIYGGLTGTGSFHISVANQGIPLHPWDVKNCVQRHWRSPDAIDSADLGSGIGLWIVTRIMTVHKGQLLVVPTNRDRITEFKLVFRNEDSTS